MSEPVARYTGRLDTSDKEDDESWCDYWDRKREERHGPDCSCILCGRSGQMLKARAGQYGLLTDEEIG